MIGRLVGWIRRLVGLALVAWAGWHLWRSWWPRGPLVGVTPWGEPTGLRLTPLEAAERAAADIRERDALGLAPAEEADCGCP